MVGFLFVSFPLVGMTCFRKSEWRVSAIRNDVVAISEGESANLQLESYVAQSLSTFYHQAPSTDFPYVHVVKNPP